MSIKSVVRKIPIIGPALFPRSKFTTSAEYWERRYRIGGNSGAGSYNRLAEFKAEFLNAFVRDKQIGSVIEFGSGDGAQLELARYPAYIGIDVSPTAIDGCRKKFSGRSELRFYHTSEVSADLAADLTLSLDVIYHLVEDAVFDRYMATLFDATTCYVIIYASNEDKLGGAPHVRHRRFTDWVAAHRPFFEMMEHAPNPYPHDDLDPTNTSFADFYVFKDSRCSER